MEVVVAEAEGGAVVEGEDIDEVRATTELVSRGFRRQTRNWRDIIMISYF